MLSLARLSAGSIGHIESSLSFFSPPPPRAGDRASILKEGGKTNYSANELVKPLKGAYKNYARTGKGENIFWMTNLSD